MVAPSSVRESALEWLAATTAELERESSTGTTAFFQSLRLFLDGGLTLYRLLGLRRSAKAVWNVATMLSYAEEAVLGLPGHRALPGDDLHVLGGDFVVDGQGRLVYAYCSKHSSDRPQLKEILSCLDDKRL